MLERIPPMYCKRILLDNIPLKQDFNFVIVSISKRILLDNIPLKPSLISKSWNLVRESY